MNNGNDNKARELNFIQHKLESREGFCHERSPDDLDESSQPLVMNIMTLECFS